MYFWILFCYISVLWFCFRVPVESCSNMYGSCYMEVKNECYYLCVRTMFAVTDQHFGTPFEMSLVFTVRAASRCTGWLYGTKETYQCSTWSPSCPGHTGTMRAIIDKKKNLLVETGTRWALTRRCCVPRWGVFPLYMSGFHTTFFLLNNQSWILMAAGVSCDLIRALRAPAATSLSTVSTAALRAYCWSSDCRWRIDEDAAGGKLCSC